jgi:phosphopantetheine adenylyltransferase
MRVEELVGSFQTSRLKAKNVKVNSCSSSGEDSENDEDMLCLLRSLRNFLDPRKEILEIAIHNFLRNR